MHGTLQADSDREMLVGIYRVVHGTEERNDDVRETRARTVAVTESTLHCIAPNAPEFAAVIVLLTMMDVFRSKLAYLGFTRKAAEYFQDIQRQSPVTLRQSFAVLAKSAPNTVAMFQEEVEGPVAGDIGGEGGI